MNELNFLGKLEMGLQLERLVIGIEEPVLVKDLGEIKAKIDSGNGGYNVIHGEDITYQGNYITFLTYDGAGNQKRLSKKVIEELDVHIGGGIVQKRPVIELDIKFANENYKKIPFSVTDRTENSHRILISKDFVENTIEALIDVGAKNISNLNYDVDYKESVNEAKNELKNMNFDDNPGADKNPDKKKVDKTAYNPDGTKADWIDKMNDWANKWRPNGSSQLTYKKDEEAVQAWPSKAFANYGIFYKKDQQNIQQKILMADEIKNELLKGDITKLQFKDNKILGNKLTGISVFSYLLKKGDAGPEGKGGNVITGQEQRRELWYTYNNDTKKAIEALKQKDKVEQNNKEEKEAEDDFNRKQEEKVAGAGQPVDGTTEMDQRRKDLMDIGAGINDSFDDFFGSLLTEAENQNQQNSQKQEKNGNLITRFSKKYLGNQKGGIDDGGRSVGSRSIDAINMEEGGKGGEDKSVTSDETLEGIKTEGERIHRLKGFIMYYIPFYNQDNSKELKSLNEKILSGSFDSDMSTFIEVGDGSSTQGAEKVSIAIKKFVTSNPTLLEKLPGAFALCYSDSLEKDAPRNIRFLSKESVIASVKNEEDLLQKLKEMLGIPDDLEETEENINAIKSLLGENSQNENENKEISIDNLKKILKTPEEMIINDNSISSLKNILDGKATSTSPEEQTGKNSTEKTSNEELNVENIKKLLSTPDDLSTDDTTITALKNVLGTNEELGGEEHNIADIDNKKTKSNSRKKTSSNTTKKNNTKTSKTNKTSEKSGNRKKQTKLKNKP